MARTESKMVDLGSLAPEFLLLDVVSGKMVSRDEVAGVGAGLLVMFVCPHCPYVKHVEAELGRIGRDYLGKIGMVAINANDVAAYPEDGPEQMREQAAKMGWAFPYLYDETQEVALEYGAACTPDFFLYDVGLRLVYRGQLDGSRPRRGDFGNDEPVTGVDLRRALEDVVDGRTPGAEQRTSLGCNIKWKGV